MTSLIKQTKQALQSNTLPFIMNPSILSNITSKSLALRDFLLPKLPSLNQPPNQPSATCNIRAQPCWAQFPHESQMTWWLRNLSAVGHFHPRTPMLRTRPDCNLWQWDSEMIWVRCWKHGCFGMFWAVKINSCYSKYNSNSPQSLYLKKKLLFISKCKCIY